MENRYVIYIIISLLTCTLSACNNRNHTYQGYIEGRYTYVSANFPGRLETLSVKRGEQVAQNQALFTLEQEPEESAYHQIQAELKQAESKVDEANSAVDLANTALLRRKQLLADGHIDQESYDRAKDTLTASKAERDAANANVSALKAALRQSIWSLNQKTIFSPKAAYVFDTYFLPGELVPANQPVLALLSDKDTYLVFFIDEPMLSKVHMNQEIHFTCDQCKENNTAKVFYISPKAEYTPPIIYSDERRAKLVYKIEAALSDPKQYHPGQPIKVTAF